jgi:glucose-6-phosphate isomerase
MSTDIKPLTKRPAWKALAAHYKKSRTSHLRKLFSADPKRGQRMTAEAVGLFLDYSKNRVTAQTLKLLFRLAEESGLRARIDAMLRGEKINITEKRAVLHAALRARRGASIIVDGRNVVPDVHAVLDKMADFSERVRGMEGHTGNAFATSSTSASAAPIGGDGLRGVEALQRAQPDVPVCFKR